MKPQTYQQRPNTTRAFYCEKAGKHDLDGTEHCTTQDDVYVILESNALVEMNGANFRSRWVRSDMPTGYP